MCLKKKYTVIFFYILSIYLMIDRDEIASYDVRMRINWSREQRAAHRSSSYCGFREI